MGILQFYDGEFIDFNTLSKTGLKMKVERQTDYYIIRCIGSLIAKVKQKIFYIKFSKTSVNKGISRHQTF